MPRARSSEPLPTPDSCSSCGVLIAPPDSTTSPARTVRSGPRPCPGQLQARGGVAPPAGHHAPPGAHVPRRPPPLPVLDADRPLALEEDLRDERAGLDGEVRPVHDRVQVGPGGAEPAPAVQVAV